MANKPTKRERREASKRARVEAEKKAAGQRRKKRLYVVLAIIAAVALIVGIVLASGGSKPVDETAINAAATAAGCDTLVKPPDQGRGHFDKVGETFNYNSNPPTTGKHYSISGVAPAPTGVHNSPIQNEYQVHNLEHGHIGIQYNNLASDIRDSLEEFTRSHPTYVFMAPRPDLPTGVVVAFTAWDRLISCKTPRSATAMQAFAVKFFDAYQGQAPEGAIAGTPLS